MKRKLTTTTATKAINTPDGPSTPMDSDSNEKLMLAFLRDRDYGGSSAAIRTLMRLDLLLRQVVPAIWALVFSHLNDRHRLLVLPLVNKQFEKSCRDPESWCTTHVHAGSLSYRMLLRPESSTRLKRIASFSSCEISRFPHQLTVKPRVITIRTTRTSIDQFRKKNKVSIQLVKQNAHHVKKLKFEFVGLDHLHIRIIPIFFLFPFHNLLELSVGPCALQDCDLFTIQTFCPSLVSLRLNGPSDSLTCKGFDALLGFTKLKTLAIQIKTLAQPTVANVRFSRLFPRLKNLILKEWTYSLFLSATSTDPWPNHQLEKFCLEEASYVSDDLTRYPDLCLPQARELTIKKNNTMSEEEFVHLLKKNPKLEVLNLRRECSELKQQSTFDEITKGNLTNLSFRFDNFKNLRLLITKTRDSLPFSKFLNVRGEGEYIRFTFGKQKREGKAVHSRKWTEEWLTLKDNLSTKNFQKIEYFIPGILKIYKSTWY